MFEIFHPLCSLLLEYEGPRLFIERTFFTTHESREHMRIAIISDIHANLSAFQAVLEYIDTKGVDEIVCLGDLVGYGAFPNECVELARERCTFSLMGNHDSAGIGLTSIVTFNRLAADAIRWTQAQLNEESKSYLKGLKFIIDRDDATFVHASPCEPEEWTYIMDGFVAGEAFDNFVTSLCFIGHTHVPFTLSEDGLLNQYEPGVRSLVNVGSVGQPRDGNPDAAFGLLDTATREYALHRVPYDIKAAADAINSAGLPKKLADRLCEGN
jgi:predicted phosphodiesterase